MTSLGQNLYLQCDILAFYLAEAGVDCDETCIGMDPTFKCIEEWGDDITVDVFNNSRDALNYTKPPDIECKQDNDTMDYSHNLHPSYNIKANNCLGYNDLPEKVKCKVPGGVDSNTRRLCLCLSEGK